MKGSWGTKWVETGMRGNLKTVMGHMEKIDAVLVDPSYSLNLLSSDWHRLKQEKDFAGQPMPIGR